MLAECNIRMFLNFKYHYYCNKFRWEELISLTKQRKELLHGAEQVHKFIRDASETNDRMNEKVPEYM